MSIVGGLILGKQNESRTSTEVNLKGSWTIGKIQQSLLWNGNTWRNLDFSEAAFSTIKIGILTFFIFLFVFDDHQQFIDALDVFLILQNILKVL